VILGCSLALAAVLWSAIAFLPGWIAPMVPASIQRTVGEAVIRDIVGIFSKLDKKKGDGQICTNREGQAALDRLVARLAAGAGTPATGPGAFQVRIANIDIPDALAAPGGRIVLFRGLIDFVRSPDELTGVLAHKMGHSIHRYPTVSIICEFGMGATLGLLLGGGIAGGTAGLLLRTGYSRDAEREGADTGFRLMQQAGLSPAGMVRLFERFEKEFPSLPKALQAFSSHPRSAERAKRLAGQARDTGGPAMSEADWQRRYRKSAIRAERWVG
jgi:predicted Zn-dependent protease